MLEELNNLKKNNNFRFIKNIEKKEGKYIFIDNKKLLNLSSNNYLGIGNNKDIEKDFFDNFYKDYSFSSSSSRLLTGNEEIYFLLENYLSKIYNKEKCLLFNSGYSANLGILSSLLNKKDVVFSDKLNHASIIDGIKLSESNLIRYNHLDYDNLENYLINHRNNYEKAIIVSETLFSMNGDLANINKLIELKKKYNCLLMIDESHSFGTFGEKGLGYCEELNCIDEVDILMSALGKACGSFGGFCVANQEIIDFFINKARSFIYSTSIPPINIAWTYFVIKNIIPNCDREYLKKLSKFCKIELEKLGYYSKSESNIIPIVFENEEKMSKMQKVLYDNGFFILPIKYPSVPKNTPLFRISLTSDIEFKDIEKLVSFI